MPAKSFLPAWLRRNAAKADLPASPPVVVDEPVVRAPTEQVAAPAAEQHVQAEATPASELLVAPADEETAAAEAPLVIKPGSVPIDSTKHFGDTTRSLVSTAPQLVALLGERVTGAAALRDIGRERHENQDHCFAQWTSFPNEDSVAPFGLFVVADGMGGHEGGAEASRLAVQMVVQTVTEELWLALVQGKRPPVQPVLQGAVQAANGAIYQAAQTAGNDMGTTCTAAVLVDRTLVIAHVGDSRALVVAGGQAKILTTDHSAIGRLIAIGALTVEEAREHPLRNQLYRTVGQQPEVQVDVVTHELRDESHLILCSDGLWGMIPQDEVVDIVIEAPTPAMAARHLVARANLLGGHDNISAVVVSLPISEGAA